MPHNNAKTILMAAVSALAFLLVLSFLFLRIESFPFHETLRLALLSRLTLTQELTPEAVEKGVAAEKSAIYVLGGHQFNLRYRLPLAAGLYRQGLAKTIIALGVPGITEYAPGLERNLTNDEWVVKTLISHGLKAADIEILSMEEGFFGTLKETRKVAALAKKRGYERLFVVSSLPHTRRLILCFGKMLDGSGVEFYVYGSKDPVGLTPLVKESVKVLVYKLFLL